MTSAGSSGKGMHWASAHSTKVETAAAAEEAAASIQRRLEGGPIDLLIVFLGRAHVKDAETVAGTLKRELSPACIIGASAQGIIADGREIESGPALTVLAARLPGVDTHPFIMMNEAWAAAADDVLEFHRCAPNAGDAELVIMLGDPFTFDIQSCLHAFNRHAPSLPVVGGMASAGAQRNTNALILNDWVGSEGGVAVALRGKLRVDVVVSQGCRPIGPPMLVSRAQGNVLFELDGQPALERAEQVLRGLKERDRESLKNGLYLGRPAHSGASGRGEYVIRNLLGADRERGLLAVGDNLADRERVRLHVRDGQSAIEDLEMLLSPQVVDSKAHAALLFTCNGRGIGLYGEPDRDITALQGALGGGVPACGMFCAGEIGPVGKQNFLHGHTASIAIVRPK